VSNLASGNFPCLNPARMHSTKCANFRTVRELAPKGGGVGCMGAIWPRPSALGFNSHRLHINFTPNIKVPHGSPRLGHVAPYQFATMMPRVRKSIHPCVLPKLFSNSTPTTSTSCHVSCTALPRQLYGLYKSTIFLPVWQIEQNMISHSSDVRLNPFKVRWVHEDEAYAPICFEAISNTLIFGLNFDPWSRF
jgi:hypothetical protein